jgi:hypothetical protein
MRSQSLQAGFTSKLTSHDRCDPAHHTARVPGQGCTEIALATAADSALSRSRVPSPPRAAGAPLRLQAALRLYTNMYNIIVKISVILGAPARCLEPSTRTDNLNFRQEICRLGQGVRGRPCRAVWLGAGPARRGRAGDAGPTQIAGETRISSC